ncbi:MAG: 1-deoxy-D-xylulose-5-phosphate synthase [Oligoflexia bacterium]|nr:1-deoxy-D-xylulose-5-phosphate synthase [Oligoflexia bacterium]
MLKDYKGLEHLKSLEIEDLRLLCDGIRSEIVEAVSCNGGHIASSLGAVELSVALHYVFNSPSDSIIWDVGHQAYAHKILTGRELCNLRNVRGVSGFPKPAESIHDPFFAGHAGVSISQAAGIAKTNPDNFSIAVIGDGSMTAGMAYEAMNHAGAMGLSNLIVVLNDNEMSISKNVGAVSSFLSNNIINNAYYQKIRSEIKSLISSIPFQKTFNVDLVHLIQKIRHSAINLIAPDALFEAFGFRYFGPFDGHDLEVLIKTFRNIPIDKKDSPPLLIHVITKKGKGYCFAEDDPSQFHGIGSFNPSTGMTNHISKLPSFTSVFGDTLVEMAEKDERVCAVTAAMKEGTGLSLFHENFPERFYDVGIAEQHAVSFAVGLSKGGAKPFVAVYSTFMQRSLDQVIHDVALNNAHVVLCLDRAGLVGEDGATHHGVFDFSYLRSIPNLVIMAPSTASEMKKMLWYSLNEYDQPVVIRYPRGAVPDWEADAESSAPLVKGKSRIVFEHNTQNGKYVTVFAIGYSAYMSKLAAEWWAKEHGKGIRVYDARFLKPLDEKTLLKEAAGSAGIITVEENVLAGGFGSSVLESLVDNTSVISVPVLRLGIGSNFIEHGTPADLRMQEKIDVQAIYEAIKQVGI